MQNRMSAAEYRREFVDGAEEAVNPYADLSKIKAASKKMFPGPMPKLQMMPQATEHEIQSAILENLGLLYGAFFWRENSGLMKLENDRYFRAGTPGIPDIMGVYKGVAIGIEVKRPGKKQSLDQKAFEQRFDQCGGVYIVCSDAGKIVEQIKTALAVKKGE